MCFCCDRPCWRDGGERECSCSDAEFHAAMGDDEYDAEDEQDFSVPLPEHARPDEEGWQP